MWLNKIKQAMAVLGLKSSDMAIRVKVPTIVAEDEAAVSQRERVNQMFIKQQHNMNTTALQAHDPTCQDNWTCTSAPCFKWESDKIVSPFYAVNKKKVMEQWTEDNKSDEAKTVDRLIALVYKKQ